MACGWCPERDRLGAGLSGALFLHELVEGATLFRSNDGDSEGDSEGDGEQGRQSGTGSLLRPARHFVYARAGMEAALRAMLAGAAVGAIPGTTAERLL